MARQRFLPLAVCLAVVPLCCLAATPDILLPNPFAVELPAETASLTAIDPPLQHLLGQVQTNGGRLAVTLPRQRLGPGAWPVILTVWPVAASSDRPVARRGAVLVVLPHGMTPVGTTGYASTPNIVRDTDGFVHMVWTDAWRAGAREGAMYRRGVILPDGTVRLDTDIQDLAPNRGNWTAMPALAAAGATIHVVWQADGTVRYRSLTRAAQTWQWSDPVDTKVPAPSREQGPAIAANALTVSILTSDATYLASGDGGRTWVMERVPFGDHDRLGTVSLSFDRSGEPLAAASVHQGSWSLRLVSRIGTGAWRLLPGPSNACSTGPEPGADAVCDGFQVLDDTRGGRHAVWYGTPADGSTLRAWYAWRPAQGTWRPGVRLVAPDPLHGLGTTAAAGLVLEHGMALALARLELHFGWRYRGDDLQLDRFRDGERAARSLPVARFMRSAMTDAEPAEALSVAAASIAPGLFRSADGRFWADILMVLNPPGVVVWQHLDVTDWLRDADR